MEGQFLKRDSFAQESKKNNNKDYRPRVIDMVNLRVTIVVKKVNLSNTKNKLIYI